MRIFVMLQCLFIIVYAIASMRVSKRERKVLEGLDEIARLVEERG